MGSREKMMGLMEGSWMRLVVWEGMMGVEHGKLWAASGDESTYLCRDADSAKGIGGLVFGRLGAPRRWDRRGDRGIDA
jgi:hypothetical protein